MPEHPADGEVRQNIGALLAPWYEALVRDGMDRNEALDVVAEAARDEREKWERAQEEDARRRGGALPVAPNPA